MDAPSDILGESLRTLYNDAPQYSPDFNAESVGQLTDAGPDANVDSGSRIDGSLSGGPLRVEHGRDYDGNVQGNEVQMNTGMTLESNSNAMNYNAHYSGNVNPTREVIKRTAFLNLQAFDLAAWSDQSLAAAVCKENDASIHPEYLKRSNATTLQLIFPSNDVRGSAISRKLIINKLRVELELPRAEVRGFVNRPIIHIYNIPVEENKFNVQKWLRQHGVKLLSDERWIYYKGTNIKTTGRSYHVEVPENIEIPGFAHYSSPVFPKPMWVEIWYPSIPPYCRRCKQKGHYARICRTLATRKSNTYAERLQSAPDGGHSAAAADLSPIVRVVHTGAGESQTAESSTSYSAAVTGVSQTSVFSGDIIQTNAVSRQQSDFQAIPATSVARRDHWPALPGSVVTPAVSVAHLAGQSAAVINEHTMITADDGQLPAFSTGSAVTAPGNAHPAIFSGNAAMSGAGGGQSAQFFSGNASSTYSDSRSVVPSGAITSGADASRPASFSAGGPTTIVTGDQSAALYQQAPVNSSTDSGTVASPAIVSVTTTNNSHLATVAAGHLASAAATVISGASPELPLAAANSYSATSAAKHMVSVTGDETGTDTGRVSPALLSAAAENNSHSAAPAAGQMASIVGCEAATAIGGASSALLPAAAANNIHSTTLNAEHMSSVACSETATAAGDAPPALLSAAAPNNSHQVTLTAGHMASTTGGEYALANGGAALALTSAATTNNSHLATFAAGEMASITGGEFATGFSEHGITFDVGGGGSTAETVIDAKSPADPQLPNNAACRRVTQCPFRPTPRTLKQISTLYSKREPFYSRGTKYTEFSNHYQRPISIDDTAYSCPEQYLFVSKALFVGNTELAQQLMTSQNPAYIEQEGGAIEFPGGIDKWREFAVAHLWRANQAKYTQHHDLQRLLLDTSGLLLVEASVDPYWGCGLAVDDFAKLKPLQLFSGKNVMGCLLTKLRSDIARNGPFLGGSSNVATERKRAESLAGARSKSTQGPYKRRPSSDGLPTRSKRDKF